MGETLIPPMKFFARFLFLSVCFCCSGHADSLDKPISVAKREQLFTKMAQLRTELSPQAASDLAISVREIVRQCETLLNAGVRAEDTDKFFVTLVDGRTPRQIILTGAGFMLAESKELNASNKTVDLGKLKGEEFARMQHLTSSWSLALAFVKMYTAPSIPQEKMGP